MSGFPGLSGRTSTGKPHIIESCAHFLDDPDILFLLGRICATKSLNLIEFLD